MRRRMELAVQLRRRGMQQSCVGGRKPQQLPGGRKVRQKERSPAQQRPLLHLQMYLLLLHTDLLC